MRNVVKLIGAEPHIETSMHVCCGVILLLVDMDQAKSQIVRLARLGLDLGVDLGQCCTRPLHASAAAQCHLK